MRPYNKQLQEYSRELRENMTDAERLVWAKTRRKQLKDRQFYRQKILGNYIVDFYCPKARLVVEVDGSQHYIEEGIKKDMLRSDYLRTLGLRVLRFSDREVFENLDGVIEKIYENL